MDANGEPEVVLVHDWLTGMRGGEKCLEVVCRRWPTAPLLTLLHRPGTVAAAISRLPIRTSFLQHLPGVHRYYRYLLPLMPAAARWTVPPCDLVVSFSHCVAKSARAPQGVPHVCYCFTPMRYAWHMREAYFAGKSWRGRVVDPMLALLRDWDRQTAERVSHFVAISATVQRRIAECYGRSSVVIHPPVDTDFYHPLPIRRDDYYLAVSAFAPYKRLDLAIEACNKRKSPLYIIGSGQDERRLKALAGPTIRFLGWQPDTAIRHHLRRCRALLFPGEEDFGIVPVEAMACGAPVIVYGRGGATETVIPPGCDQEPTGLWFEEQTVECLGDILAEFERCGEDFSPIAARRQAVRFNHVRYADELLGYLATVLNPPAVPQRRAA